jgi:hypothetical protein
MQRFQIKKNILIVFSTFLLTIQLVEATPPKDLLISGDSLFKAGKYTESFEEYQTLLDIYNQYTPQMLLKMAFIKEGLGDYTNTLYYLNLYFLEKADREVIDKISTLATQHDLDGYKMSDNEYFSALFRQYYLYIFGGFLLIGILLLFMMIKNTKRQKEAVAPGMLLLTLTAIFFLAGNVFLNTSKAIIAKNNTLMMSAPSAGATLIRKAESGHRVEILDKEDIWYKVVWNNKEGYIRNSQLLLVK